MHRSSPVAAPVGQDRLWLVAGTGEGPPLAAELLQRGWRVWVSVVTAAAARAYDPHPALEIEAGALGPQGVAQVLQEAVQQGRPFRWVVDASHPFAVRISAELQRACAGLEQPLLRLRREDAALELTTASGAPLLSTSKLSMPKTSPPEPLLLDGVSALEGCGSWQGRRLLLAIGSRQLPEALASSGGAHHFARVLPAPSSLALALAAGLPPERIACLRPAAGAAVERALCRRWAISHVLCRQSGGRTETLWRTLAAELGLHLLLLRAPPEPDSRQGLSWAALLERIGWPG
ncbi:precorrin-6A/cobalt-precorrin-6A reductase [Synechococcus sp. CS-1328]|uniref:precorrin-6A/cobalt-precorrin-6A reductase n=1 Tax=Synechococcus sp. CS-1328 TaxID=2847976 RepID=UPI00223B282E|nr:precorrin-6A/cobalt-precorrin-6A reductase [Synechococcus sp. CS-1328]MCT0225131.1 precorrin-6A/cobalt-precorrin-6A reductase [Synechococcus sp. CS-1328]